MNILTAKDGTKVIAVPQADGRDVACAGCIFDDHQKCADFAGQDLLDVCVEESVIFIDASEQP